MSNLDNLRSRLDDIGTDAILLTHMDNVRWSSGFTGSSAGIVLTGTGGAFVTDSRYTQQAAEQVPELDVVIYKSPQSMAEALADQAKSRNVKRLAFESEYVSVASHKTFSEAFNGIELVPFEGIAMPLRMVKTTEEVARIRDACALADACYDHIIRMIQPGVTEYDIALDIEFYFRRSQAELAFSPIVVSGERSARPHGIPSEKKLEVGDFVTMDFGAKLNGYCSDLTRTVVVGEASDRHRAVYEAVLEAQIEGLAAIRPGIPAKDADAAARDVLAKHGLAEYFGHGLGHGLGSVVHDGGRMGPTSTDTLAVGQVWTVEPGAYIPDFGGVRIEDDVVVTEDGCEILTHAPKHLQTLP